MNPMLTLTTAISSLALILAGCGASTGGTPAPAAESGAPGDGQGDGGGGQGGGEGDGAEAGGGAGGTGEAGGGDQGGDQGGDGAEGEGEGEVGPMADPSTIDTGWGHTLIMDTIAIGGDGFDLDGDGRADNALGLAALMANTELEESLSSGDMILLADLRADDAVNNGPFSVNMYSGVDTDDDPANNFNGEASVQIDLRSFDANGAPLISFADAEIAGGVMSASTDSFELAFPVGEDGAESMFRATLYLVQMEADVADGFGGLFNGKIGGAAREEEIRVAIEAFDIPDNLRSMLDGFLSSPDIDTDNDGIPDAFSIALTFTATTCTFAEGFANPL